MPSEPSVAINFRVSVDLANALDKYCADETVATGNPTTRADVVRMAISQYIGLTRPRNGQPPQAPAPAE
jgi:hypothetical protein